MFLTHQVVIPSIDKVFIIVVPILINYYSIKIYAAET